MLGNFVSGSNSASVTLLQVGRSPRRIEMMNCQSAFLESYRPPLDGERYLTDGEVSELLRVSRRTLQESGSELPQAAGVRRFHEKVNG